MTVTRPVKSDIIKVTDEGISEYIELPKDTIFAESIATNEKYESGGVGYLPIQRKSTKDDGTITSHIYKLTPGMKEAEHYYGPVEIDGTTDITIFGCALTSTGKLWLCIWNKNLLAELDLADKTIGHIIPCVAPNDVAVDPTNEDNIFAAAGTMKHILNVVEFANAARGRVIKYYTRKAPIQEEVIVHGDGLDTLAGIGVFDDKVYVSQLFDVFTTSADDSSNEKTIVWDGTEDDDHVWLADNMDRFEERYVLTPAYTTVPKTTVDRVYKRNFIASARFFAGQVITMFTEGEGFAEAFKDPEVAISLSNTFYKQDEDVPTHPIRIVIMDPKDDSKMYHFEVDLKYARSQPPMEFDDGDNKKKYRSYFNEQVTHAAQLKNDHGSYLVCINFECPRVLLLKDDVFREALSS